MNSYKIKILLYAIFLILLGLPLVYMIVPLKIIEPLKGAVDNAKQPQITIATWFNGEYQKKCEDFFNDNIGFRPWFVKLHNQIKFSLFNEASARGVIRGKENYLYELNYIKAYNGEDFIGKREIYSKVKSIKQLQDKLLEYNKTLLVCISPGKGSFYPEYFPDDKISTTEKQTDSTNYKQYSEALKQLNVNHIDMNGWFKQMKDTCNCMLYPKYGIHWSYYGMLLATDSIIKYIEDARKIQMPKIEFGKIIRSSVLKHSDYDIAEGMNLLLQMKSEPMCYPKFKFSSDSNLIKPKTLVVSDSFYWGIFNIGVGSEIFSLGGFWYYNEQIYPDSYDSPITVNDVDFAQKVLENDVIILMSTDANLPKFSWGFMEKAKNTILNSNFHIDQLP